MTIDYFGAHRAAAQGDRGPLIASDYIRVRLIAMGPRVQVIEPRTAYDGRSRGGEPTAGRRRGLGRMRRF